MISGYLLAPSGEKMSKSKGNVISPLEIIEKFGSDAMRFWAACAKLGVDMSYMEKDIVTGQKTITKVWNAARFAFMQLEDYKGEKKGITEIDKWMLTKLNKLIKSTTESFENYDYSKAKSEVDLFFWGDLCDNYLEIIKDRMYNPQKYKEGKTGAQYVLNKTILGILKMFAPIMPFITEEIYQMKFAKDENKKSIHISDWPEYNEKEIDENAEKSGDLAVKIISAVRKFKSEHNVSLKTEIKKLIIDTKHKKLLDELIQDIKATTNSKEIEFGKGNINISDDLSIDVQLA